jgi:ribose transport system substrate-binding protein
MLTKFTKFVLLVAVLITVTSILTSCEAPATPTLAAATALTNNQASAPTAVPEKKPFTIGISNAFISSEYRTQMIDELKVVNAEYMAKGITTDLVIESADTNVAGQIQQLQNLMARNVDAILVNPGEVSGLNVTLEEAVNKGIVVISVDQALDARGVYDVGIDQREWAKKSAQWLADKLGGKGNIVEIEAFPGLSTNLARINGVDEVFGKYPDIKIIGKVTGKWGEATGREVLSNFLSAYPTMDAYWVEDGMAIGAFQAVLDANPTIFPVVVGEGRCQFLQLWADRLKVDPTFETIAVANPPGVSPTGLRIAINMLLGKKIDPTKLGGPSGTQFVIPIPVIVTKDNFQQVFDSLCNGKPASYLVDRIMTDDEVQQFFVK